MSVSLPIDRKAPTERIALDDRSWVDVVRAFAPDPGDSFDQLRDRVTWTQGRSVREGRLVPDPRLGGSLSVDETAAVPVLHFARLAIEARYRIRLGGTALVFYRNGRDSVGFHSDDELRYLDDTIIAGLCLGAARPVALRARASSDVRTIVLAQGDLYVMGGRCQADWLHAIPKVEDCGPRISAIWRWTSRRGPPSSSPTQYVPDAPRKRHWR
jgi:alkylated DNA repair dioxygenase AlkB